MEKKIIFSLDSSPVNEGTYVIRINHNDFFIKGTTGSCNVIMARLFNVSFPDFLRLCRDEFGAELVGKNTLYPVPYFKQKALAQLLCDNLNARANTVLWERENQEAEEHAKVVLAFENRERSYDIYGRPH